MWKEIVGEPFSADEFHDYVASLAFDQWRPQFAVLHNTAVPTLADWHRHPGEVRMRGLEHWYRDVKGWSAGPHLFIADDVIWVFTPLTTSGRHSPSWNAISWGIEVVGDYTQEIPSPKVVSNTLEALVALHATVGIDPAAIRPHREDPLTTHKECPGPNLDFEGIRAALIERLRGPAVVPSVPHEEKAAALEVVTVSGTRKSRNKKRNKWRRPVARKSRKPRRQK
jgi:hypothetical protein